MAFYGLQHLQIVKILKGGIKEMIGEISKYIIVVRAGDDEEGVLKLTLTEKLQVLRVSELITKKIGDADKVILLTSPEERTVETASVFGYRLGVEPLRKEFLKLDRYGHGKFQMEQILRVVKKLGGCDVIVAVIHYKAVNGVIDSFSQRFFKKSVVGSERIMKGSGFCLCTKTGEISLL